MDRSAARVRGYSIDRISGRRSIAQHIIEVFAKVPANHPLTIAQIAAEATSQYDAGEASAGAILNRLRKNKVPGVIITGDSPVKVERQGP